MDIALIFGWLIVCLIVLIVIFADSLRFKPEDKEWWR